MAILIIIEIALIVIIGFFVCYLAALSLLAVFASGRSRLAGPAQHRIAVIVPAHNEETSIRRTLASLSAVDYPAELRELIVVADNCTDHTVEVARSMGAGVLERINPNERGKGYALRWAFDILLNRTPPCDAIAIVDADTVVPPNFLRALDARLVRGARAIQCNDQVEPRPGAWTSEIIRLGFALYNHVRPLGRGVLGLSAGVRGNGMCFSSDTLRTVPWNTISRNEDLEYGLVLILHGIGVEFAPETTVLAAMPTKPRAAESQRDRWERGRYPVIRDYTGRLLAASLRQRSLVPLDAAIDLLVPPFVNLLGIAIVLGLFTVLLQYSLAPPLGMFTPWWIAIVLLGILHVLLGLYAIDAGPSLYKTFFYIPRYVVWKVWLYAKKRSSGTEWIRTQREPGSTGSPSDDGMKG